MTVDSKNPHDLFGGNWELVKDRFLVGAGNSYQVGNTGGEATHTLTVNEMPSHTHKLRYKLYTASSGSFWIVDAGSSDELCDNGHYAVQYTGNNQPHNNLPPYLAVFIWKRTS